VVEEEPPNTEAFDLIPSLLCGTRNNI
jgi:hypothetical protein